MDLPKDIQEFLQKNIDSVAELEALLIFRREREHAFGADEMSRRLYVKEAEADRVLQVLQQRGFLATARDSNPTTRTFVYQPASGELASAVDAVADFYAQYLIPVTNFIHSKPKSAVAKFADAFRLRERK